MKRYLSVTLFLGFVLFSTSARADCASQPWVSTSANVTTLCSKVGIGTANPTGMFHIFGAEGTDVFAGIGYDTVNGPAMNFGYAGGSIAPGVGFFNIRPDSLASAPNPSLRFLTVNVERAIITNTGMVGFGTAASGAAPAARLHVYENADTNSIVLVENPNTGLGTAAAFRAKSDVATVNFEAHSSTRTLSRFGVALGGWTEFLSVSGNGLLIGTYTATPLILGTASTAHLMINPTGQVSVNGLPAGTQSTDAFVVNGTVRGTNVIATYQDVAEWVPATQKMAPGTVVVIDTESENRVTPSLHSYDTRVAGVISAQPGVSLGVEAPSKEQVATTGRVKVRVDASQGAIHIGDLLVTGDQPGVAMRSEPIDVGGAKIHRPGTLIGKALEPLNSGQGTILVLLSLQ